MNVHCSAVLLQAFGRALAEQEKSPATVRKYLRDVGQFLRFAGGERLNRTLVLRYKERIATRYAASSANSMLAALNAFFRFSGRVELCVRQLKVQRAAYVPEEQALQQDEYQRLVQAARDTGNERLAMILQTICATGIRVSELQHITVEAARRGEATVRCKGKTRTILLVKELRRGLLSYAGGAGISRGPIFVTRRGKPVARTAVWREMKALCARACVTPEKVFPHNLRHLFARVFYAAAKDIAKLADVLGHSSVNTTRIYLTTTCDEHRRCMERLPLVFPPKRKKPGRPGRRT